MLGVRGLYAFRIDTIRVPQGPTTFNHLVLTFEDGKEVRVPVTEATADEIRAALQRQASLQCKNEQLSPTCAGCNLCDPARQP